MYFLGIDAGTSGLKTLLIDDHGTVRAQASATYDLHTPCAGCAESEPEDWWQALCSTTSRTLSGAAIAPTEIAAIGFSGQMHTLVLLDGDNRPLRPAISWADTRGAGERVWLEQHIGREHLISITGSPALTAFTATKLLWVQRHEPEIWRRARHAMLAKDYLRLRLTGVLATDPSDAGATGLLDVRRRAWSPELLGALDLAPDFLPPIQPSTAVAGSVTAAAATETGLAAGTPVATGAGDQECAALGCGIVAPGPLLITAGSGGQLFAATTSPVIDPLGRVHALPHALPDLWHLLAAMPTAGLALTWWRTILPDAKSNSDEAVGPQPPLFLPALAGERTPSMDEEARGVLFGLDLTHRAADVRFAAWEGVAFGLRACVETLLELGIPADPIVVTGGLGTDPSFRALLADVLGRPLRPAAQSEGSGYGAALLGALAAGVSLAPLEPLLGDDIVQPRPERSAWHDRRFATYQKLQPAAQQFRYEVMSV